MPIRPIDMQVLLPKAIRIDQAKPAVVNKVENAQQLAQAAQQQQTIQKQQKINALEQRDMALIKKKEDRQPEGRSKKKKSKSQDPNRGRHVDMKV
jgi:hypothetical protein